MFIKYIIKLFVILFLFLNSLNVQAIQPLSNNSIEELLMDENANHIVLEGCISLYSAVTELTKKKYPKLASEFYESANTLYPYGIISLSHIKKISYEEAEIFFFHNVTSLTNEYINEMNKNGKKNGSYFKGSFLGDDLFFCNEVAKSIKLIIMESLGE